MRVIMEDRWLSVDEIATYLGIKRDTVYKWVGRKNMHWFQKVILHLQSFPLFGQMLVLSYLPKFIFQNHMNMVGKH